MKAFYQSVHAVFSLNGNNAFKPYAIAGGERFSRDPLSSAFELSRFSLGR
jgi:hypothetical protein